MAEISDPVGAVGRPGRGSSRRGTTPSAAARGLVGAKRSRTVRAAEETPRDPPAEVTSGAGTAAGAPALELGGRRAR